MKPTVFHTLDTYPQSVEVVVPLIIEMLNPRSVVDFGCGVGGWLEGFRRRDVRDVLGIDGPYMTDENLIIPREAFIACNLEHTRQLTLNRSFDVALCLECAEHLHADVAPFLIETLCRVAPHVVFSAAVPGQTGMGHKNEQYPDYWQEMFAHHGFQMYDYFRPLVWNDRRVEFWYRQNMYLFSSAPHQFARPTSSWDGRVYIARDLLEMYVRSFNTRNAERLISAKNLEMLRSLSIAKSMTIHSKVVAKLRSLVSRVLGSSGQ